MNHMPSRCQKCSAGYRCQSGESSSQTIDTPNCLFQVLRHRAQSRYTPSVRTSRNRTLPPVPLPDYVHSNDGPLFRGKIPADFADNAFAPGAAPERNQKHLPGVLIADTCPVNTKQQRDSKNIRRGKMDQSYPAHPKHKGRFTLNRWQGRPMKYPVTARTTMDNAVIQCHKRTGAS